MGKSRPQFNQPPPRHCMWAKCPNLNMVSTDVDMCLRHAIIIGDRLDQNAQIRKQRAEDERAAAQFDKIEEKQKQWQLERVLAGKPQRDDLYFKVHEQWVYYIQVGEHIKIGYTRDLPSRLRAYPPDAPILGIEYGNKALEKERHHQFGAYLAYGREWFHPNQELLDHIAGLPPYKHLLPKRMRKGPATPSGTIKPRYWR